jgi:arylsulfatase A-like enzyme
MTSAAKPNILVLVVDQMRAPQWFPAADRLGALLPNLEALRQRSLSFASHYSASNMCTPSRGVMTTGLYSHQTGCLYTGEGPGESTLAPRFPTWGTMLREAGYATWWWGKWHLGSVADNTPDGLEAHGFSGGTYPSPNGGPKQGLAMDPSIVDQFTEWFDAAAGDGPWCTTVSLVNPHADGAEVLRRSRAAHRNPDVGAGSHRRGAHPGCQVRDVLLLAARQHDR